MHQNKSAQKIFLVFALLLAVFIPKCANASSLYITPTSGVYNVGDIVTVNVMVSSGVSLNAVSGTVVVPPAYFSIQSVLKSGSVLNFWVTEPSVTKSTGSVHFEGVALNGFKGEGSVITIVVKATKAGSSGIVFQSGQVLANDGQGTDISGSVVGNNLSLKEAILNPDNSKTPPTPITPKTEIKPQKQQTEKKVEIIENNEVKEFVFLTPPEINLGTKYGDNAVLGVTEYLDSDVLVTFVSESGVKVFVTTKPNSQSGEFSVLVPSSLKDGYYTVSAYAAKPDGSRSQQSKEVLVDIKNSSVPYNEIAAILGVLIVFFLSYLIFTRSYQRRSQSSKIDKFALKHDVRQVENVLHKSFDVLREDIDSESRVRTSVGEKTRALNLKKDLNEVEEMITKEIEDINKNANL